MNSSEQQPEQLEDDRPPVFNTWNQVYLFVLLLHAMLITLFYIFTRSYA